VATPNKKTIKWDCHKPLQWKVVKCQLTTWQLYIICGFQLSASYQEDWQSKQYKTPFVLCWLLFLDTARPRQSTAGQTNYEVDDYLSTYSSSYMKAPSKIQEIYWNTAMNGKNDTMQWHSTIKTTSKHYKKLSITLISKSETSWKCSTIQYHIHNE